MPLLLSLLVLNSGCHSEPRISVSAAGMRQCRERQADLPIDSTPEQQRENYHICLKGIDAQLAAQTEEAQAQEQQRLQDINSAETAESRSWASPSDRLTHCLLVQEQVIRGEQARQQAIGPVMELSKRYGVSSPQAQQANAVYQEAVAELGRLIPAEMRHGDALLPTSVNLFMRCDRRQLGVDG